MRDERTPDTHRRTRPGAPDDVDGSLPAAYDEWSDERLVDGYRRNSRLLREYGTDRRTIRTLCAIEERLRARGLDPDRIVAEMDV